MQTSSLFNYTMRALWGDAMDDMPNEARAIASWVKTHVRINPECALDVLGVVWPESKVSARLPDNSWCAAPDDDASTVIYDVVFADSSSVLLVSHRGVASELEVTS